ncbi:MAG: leucine-rich repeat protein, partial [Corallococcus sp.]|nr:leucine-rich repeat protein [Corallococcus sp.]
DKITGEVVWSKTDWNANKAYSLGADPVPYYDYLRLYSRDLGLINNRQYEFKMFGLLDYGDGGVAHNVRNSFSFDFYLDDEAPILKEVFYEKEYDENLKKDRYYITMTIYDNQYVQSVSPIRFTSNSSYAFLTDNPIPVYSQKGTDNTVRFEITSYLDDLFADSLITSGLAFSIDDYALNSNIYVCQLPGTKGEFKFTKDGDIDGTDLIILSLYEGEIVDITKYLATEDETVDADKDYLKYLNWTSSNEKVVEVLNGQVKCVNEGRATVTVKEQMDLNQAVLIINVKPRPQNYSPSNNVVDSVDGSGINELRFSYFETVFAYSRAAQTSEIGSTGGKMFISSMNSVSFYPGEKIKLIPDLKPWYTADKYKLTYTSTNPSVAIVDEDGVVTGLKKGNATIALQVEGSRLIARLSVEIKSEFVIENRTLIAYKGLGGDVVIPDDEGILYIGAYSFCLYDTDNTFELTEDDYDANKIPNANTSITSVTIPHGVEEIQKYAFHKCSGLRTVILPDTLKIIREYAFYEDKKLENVSLTGTKVETIGRSAFMNCQKLANIDLSRVYAIGVAAFDGCTSLKSVDLTSLRNTGAQAFQNCTALNTAILNKATKLSYAMFAKSGLTSIDIYSQDCDIPTFCFAKCEQLASVTVHNDIEKIGTGAFSDCYSLATFTMKGKVNVIGDQAFYNDKGLVKFTLPDNEVTLENYAFYKCGKLEEIVLMPNTVIVQKGGAVTKDEVSSANTAVPANVNGYIFADTKLVKFTVMEGNTVYSVSGDGSLLLTDNGKTVLLAAIGKQYGDYTLDAAYEKIGEGAFAGADITSVTVTNVKTSIGDYAFANCANLATVNLPNAIGVTIGNYAFNNAEKLTAVNNLEYVKQAGRYAFASTGLEDAVVGSDAVYGEGAFIRSKLKSITVGENAAFGFGAFQDCSSLVTVNMPEQGGVYFGKGCFARDVSLKTIDLTKVGDTIPDECFYKCSSLVLANLANVKHVGDYAFADCSSLSKVYVPLAEYI